MQKRSSTGASQIVRLAEKHLTEGKFELAMEELSRAKAIEPKNKYIEAIIERAKSLSKPEPVETVVAAQAPIRESDPMRYLSVTVGKEFDDGIKPRATPAPPAGPSPSEISNQIRTLTDVAERLLKQGYFESAFDSLMRAYLLDPLSPFVAECEKDVLPAWEDYRARREAQAAKPMEAVATVEVSAVPADPEQDRLQSLMDEKESERQARERELWREASSLPRIFMEDGVEQPTAPEVREHPLKKRAAGLISKLKRNKPS